MKKLTRVVMLITSIVLIHNQLLAQVEVGLQFGSISTEFSGDKIVTEDFARYKMGHSYQVGLVLRLPLREGTYFSINPAYKKLHGTLQVGFEIPLVNGPILIWVDDTNLRVDYLNLAMALDILSKNEKWSFASGLEPALAVSKTKTKLATGEKTTISDQFTDFNFSIFFGIGYRIRIKTSVIRIGVQWTQGLINITDGLNTESEFPRIKTSTYETRISWLLPIGKGKSTTD